MSPIRPPVLSAGKTIALAAFAALLVFFAFQRRVDGEPGWPEALAFAGILVVGYVCWKVLVRYLMPSRRKP